MEEDEASDTESSGLDIETPVGSIMPLVVEPADVFRSTGTDGDHAIHEAHEDEGQRTEEAESEMEDEGRDEIRHC